MQLQIELRAVSLGHEMYDHTQREVGIISTLIANEEGQFLPCRILLAWIILTACL